MIDPATPIRSTHDLSQFFLATRLETTRHGDGLNDKQATMEVLSQQVESQRVAHDVIRFK